MTAAEPDRPELNPYEPPQTLNPSTTGAQGGVIVDAMSWLAWAFVEVVGWLLTILTAVIAFVMSGGVLSYATWGLATGDWRQAPRDAIILGLSGWIGYKVGRGIRWGLRKVAEA